MLLDSKKPSQHVCRCELLRITYSKTESPHLVGRATPDAGEKARPTVNHLTVMNYVKLNNSHLQKQGNILNTSPQQIIHMLALFNQFAIAAFHMLASQFTDRQVLHDVIFTLFAPYRKTVDHALGDPVAAIGRDAPAHPVVVMCAEHPVVDMRDGRIRGARRTG